MKIIECIKFWSSGSNKGQYEYYGVLYIPNAVELMKGNKGPGIEYRADYICDISEINDDIKKRICEIICSKIITDCAI